MKKRGLGRGLDALLGSSNLEQAQTNKQPTPQQQARGLHSLPVDLIDRSPYQPRSDFNQAALEELASSIRAQGVVQPIVVRPRESNRFELIAGERRWRAAQLAGLHEIPAVIREDVDEQSVMAMALIENIQRQDLNPMEEAIALQRLIDEFGLTHEQTADAVGRSRVSVTNMLRLLKLEEGVKALLVEGQLEMGHARALLALSGGAQYKAGKQIADRGLSVREAEHLVKKLANPPAKAQSSASRKDPDTLQLENDLSDRLGARVQFQIGRNGKGKLIIQYNSLDELDGILGHIK